MMRKKIVITMLVMTMICNLTACGKKQELVTTTTTERVELTTETPEVEATATADAGQVTAEASGKIIATATAESTENQKKNTDKKVKKETLEGEFSGFADGNSVEIMVNGQATVFQVGTESANAILEKTEEGAKIIFDVETQDSAKTITKVYD